MKIQVFWDGTLCRLVNGNRLVEGRLYPVSTGSSSLVIIYQSIRRNAPKYFNFITYVDTGTHRLSLGQIVRSNMLSTALAMYFTHTEFRTFAPPFSIQTMLGCAGGGVRPLCRVRQGRVYF